MYDLDASKNVLEIHDRLVGAVLEFYYTLPTNPQRTEWDNLVTVRKGSRVVIKKDYQLLQARFGARLLTGFKKGVLAKGGKLIASDPDDPDYYKDWKNLVYSVRPDWLAYAARVIMSPVEQPDTGIEYEDAESGDVIEDLDNPEFGFEEQPDQAAPAEAEASPLAPQ
jgi:hypothetical protein